MGGFTDEQWGILYRQAYNNIVPGGYIEQELWDVMYVSPGLTSDLKLRASVWAVTMELGRQALILLNGAQCFFVLLKRRKDGQ